MQNKHLMIFMRFTFLIHAVSSSFSSCLLPTRQISASGIQVLSCLFTILPMRPNLDSSGNHNSCSPNRRHGHSCNRPRTIGTLHNNRNHPRCSPSILTLYSVPFRYIFFFVILAAFGAIIHPISRMLVFYLTESVSYCAVFAEIEDRTIITYSFGYYSASALWTYIFIHYTLSEVCVSIYQRQSVSCYSPPF